MSANLKLIGTAGGSVSLQVNDALTTDETFKFNGADVNGTVLTGADLTAVNIIGANPAATLWQDGSITGSSDNGTFTKHVNGNLECEHVKTTSSDITGGSGSIFQQVVNGTNLYPIVFISVPTVTKTLGTPAATLCWLGGINTANAETALYQELLEIMK